MRGKKTSSVDKEKVKALILLNPEASQRDIARQANMPLTTVHELSKEVVNSDEFEQARTLKKQEFIQQAWDIVKKALLAVDKKVDTFLNNPEILDKTNVRDIAIALGTIYDKQALASGEPTNITESHKTIPDLMKETEQKLVELKKLTGS